MPDQQPIVKTLRLPAASDDLAGALSKALLDEGVDTDGIDGRHVLVPTGGHHTFVWLLAEFAVERGYADDHEVAQWAREETAR